MHFRFSPSTALAVILASAPLGTVQAAAVSATTNYGEIRGGTDSDQASDGPFNLRAFVSDSVFDGSSGTAEATLESVPGGFLGLQSKVELRARAAGTAGDTIGSRASASASWGDTIHWLNPEIVFDITRIAFIFAPTIRGNLSGFRAEAAFVTTVGPEEKYFIRTADGSWTTTSSALVSGEPLSNLGMTITMELTVTAGADPNEPASIADFSHTAWLPAIQMVDLDGNPVPGGENAILKGESGVEYAMWSPGFTYAADFDEDLDVDIDDLALWKAGLGATSEVSHVSGDADFNGVVNGDDFLIWQRQNGSGTPQTQVVPEPSAATLGAIALAILAAKIKRAC